MLLPNSRSVDLLFSQTGDPYRATKSPFFVLLKPRKTRKTRTKRMTNQENVRNSLAFRPVFVETAGNSTNKVTNHGNAGNSLGNRKNCKTRPNNIKGRQITKTREICSCPVQLLLKPSKTRRTSAIPFVRFGRAWSPLQH